jgi:hypothetical protein
MPAGVVSESDLLLKERFTELANADSPLHPWRRRQEREKAHGVIASELATAPAITVGLDTPMPTPPR